MKRILLAVSLMSLAISATNMATANTGDPGVGSLPQQFRENLKVELDTVYNDVKLQISSRKLDFSDYEYASKSFLTKIKASRATYESELKKIEDFLSWYETIRNASQSDASNRAIDQLYKQKMKELDKLREEYKDIAAKFLLLNDNLFVPVESWTTTTIKDITGDIRFMDKDRVSMTWHNGLYTSIYSVWRDTLFGDCQTQGCVYYLAEDYMNWFQSINKVINKVKIPVDGLKDLEGRGILGKRKVQESLDFMADLAANGKASSL